MKNSPKKAGRRTKGKILHENIEPADPSFPRTVKSILADLSVDPTWSEELNMFFGPLITHRADDHFRKFAGIMLALMVEKGSSEVLEEIFSRILAMKRNAESAADGKLCRNAVALVAWEDFVAENGFSPTKPKLKKFILKNPRKYQNMPGVGDPKGWTRLWQDSGLRDMEG